MSSVLTVEEVNSLVSERDALRERVEALEQERDRLRVALEQVRERKMQVCSAYDICGPDDCVAPKCGPWAANNASYEAYAIAAAALAAEHQEPQESKP